MKLKEIPFLKSKNKRLFFKGGLLLMLMMALFYIGSNHAKTTISYLAFGFLWLSVIISVCFIYLVPRDKEEIRKLLSVGLGIYLTATVLCNTLLAFTVSITVLVAVDFLLTFAIIIYGLILYFGGNRKDSPF